MPVIHVNDGGGSRGNGCAWIFLVVSIVVIAVGIAAEGMGIADRAIVEIAGFVLLIITLSNLR